MITDFICFLALLGDHVTYLLFPQASNIFFLPSASLIKLKPSCNKTTYNCNTGNTSPVDEAPRQEQTPEHSFAPPLT